MEYQKLKILNERIKESIVNLGGKPLEHEKELNLIIPDFNAVEKGISNFKIINDLIIYGRKPAATEGGRGGGGGISGGDVNRGEDRR